MRLQSRDYALSIFNMQNLERVPIYQTGDLSIGTDFKSTITVEIANNGIVSIEQEDAPITVLSFTVNLITTPPRTDMNALSWLAAIAGEKSIGRYREDFFAVGRTTSHYPDNLTLTEISDFDRGITQGSLRTDGWTAVRNPKRRNLSRVHAMINAQTTNIELTFPVDGMATAAVTLETDGISTYIRDMKGCDIDVKIAGMADQTAQTIQVESFSQILRVWVNWRPVTGFSTSGGNTIDFSAIPQDKFYLTNGDVVKYIYIPTSGELIWNSYRQVNSEFKDGGTVKSQIMARILTDTTADRVVYGYYPIHREEGNEEPIWSDGTQDCIPIKAGHVWINDAYYFAGFTEGEVDSVSEGANITTIGDVTFTESTSNFWKGATLTMMTGVAAGETLKVSSYTTGSFVLQGTFSSTPAAGDEFRLNAYKVVASNTGHDTIYAYLSGGVVVIGTGTAASPPSNSIILADVTCSGTPVDFDTYTDNRQFQGSFVDRVQEVSYSIPLEREEVEELGYEWLVDRHLNKPVNIVANLSATDVGTEIVAALSSYSNDTIKPAENYTDTLGIQVMVYTTKPITADKAYDETKIGLLFETTNSRPTTDSLATSVEAHGETSFSLIGDNFRAMVVV